MFRRGNLMADDAATSSLPLRDVCEYDLLFDFVHCGLCAEACPTYITTRCEMDSPRGRIYLMKSLAEGSIELDDDAARHLDLCLGCRGCEAASPRSFPIPSGSGCCSRHLSSSSAQVSGPLSEPYCPPRCASGLICFH